jgi:hypothetical protein
MLKNGKHIYLIYHFQLKIEINVWNIFNGESMDLTEYKTEFLAKRKLTGIKSIGKVDENGHKTSLLIMQSKIRFIQ